VFEGGAHPNDPTSQIRGRRRARRGAVDGLIVGGREVWLVVAASKDDVARLLRDERGAPEEPPLRLCRAVLDDGVLVLGGADPSRDPLVSDLMRRDEGGRG
jgi:hypothetical protein